MLIECGYMTVLHSRGSNEWVTSAIVNPVPCEDVLYHIYLGNEPLSQNLIREIL